MIHVTHMEEMRNVYKILIKATYKLGDIGIVLKLIL
jgi:hypothetical protein